MRDPGGAPLVLRNAPLLDDGTPMPTRYWLVASEVRRRIDRLESGGGVRAAEAEVDPVELADAHRRYAAERDAAVPEGWAGPRPSGGVGGTRTGVKCLHAHYAWHLAGGDDPVGRWTAERLGPQATAPVASGAVAPDAAQVVAAVDCGTNSTRLLVADGEGRTLERLMEITRLGAGVDRTGRLDPAAIERTVAVLRRYRAVMDRHGVERVRITATSAARDASNRADFLTAAGEAVGAAPELLGGDEEGRLSFAGATADLDAADGPWLVADIGGGSTELAAGPGPGADRLVPVAVRSIDIGCVRLTERALPGDPPSSGDVAAARAIAADLVAGALAEVPALRTGRRLVGLAGTVAALAALDVGLDTYDRSAVHHHWLARARVSELVEGLAADDVATRRRRAGMEAARADVIVGGAIVLEAILAALDVDGCLSSESDILDGLVMSMLA